MGAYTTTTLPWANCVSQGCTGHHGSARGFVYRDSQPGYPGDLTIKCIKPALSRVHVIFKSIRPVRPVGLYPGRHHKMARKAVETGAFILFEIENGHYRLTGHSCALPQARIGAPYPNTSRNKPVLPIPMMIPSPPFNTGWMSAGTPPSNGTIAKSGGRSIKPARRKC